MTSKAGLDRHIEKLQRCELISEGEAIALCMKGKELLLQDPNVLRIKAPITVCGDIHGQFYDLLELFSVAGTVPDTNFLFLGDYVDRGRYGLETFLLLLALKLRYPNRISLLRGNHECRQITQGYGFYEECVKKCGSINIWKECMSVFDALPLAAVIDEKVFCVHGGLSPTISTIDQINGIDRNQEVMEDSTMADLLWSDPIDLEEMGIVWYPNTRGVGYLFARDAVDQFNHSNNIDLICRSHQLVMSGYAWYFGGKLVTVWSAPNYCYRCGNAAAVMQLDEDVRKQEFLLFEEAPQELREPKKGPKPDPTSLKTRF